ncbi:hypothetical protein [Dongia sp.]|uniref:hypothetical protein n=1 Tax=Dongia sp. TaxID=1977262 RepID=UPI0035AF4FC9
MRKLFATLLTLSLLGGLFLAVPQAVAAIQPVESAHHGLSMTQPADCEHHAPKQTNKQADFSCCITGHCPMLGQGILPMAGYRPQPMIKPLLRPASFLADIGIESGPDLRPPRILV